MSYSLIGDCSKGNAKVDDPYNLQRFVNAQRDLYQQVCSELQSGYKRGHWMWFVFPQIRGLGHSQLANEFAISSLDEAKAYLDQPLLGPRLRECTRFVIEVEGCSIEEIFGYPDNLKFKSSMTLFAHAATDNEVFEAALMKYFRGERDRLTLERV
jgi:uncharacterized protein (DUF1810 family)